MFQQQFGGFGGQAQLAALQKKEKADRERAEFEAKLGMIKASLKIGIFTSIQRQKAIGILSAFEFFTLISH